MRLGAHWNVDVDRHAGLEGARGVNDAHADLEDELGSLVFGLHVVGRELRLRGDEADAACIGAQWRSLL